MNAQLPRIAPAIGSSSTGLSPYFKSGAGTRVMVADQQRQILDALYAMAGKPSSQGYHALSMTKAVERLRAGGDLPNAQFQHHRPQRRCLVHSGFEIEYEVSPGFGRQGTIEIVEIRLQKDDVKEFKRPGIWKIKENERGSATNKWEVDQWLPDLSNIPAQSSMKVGVNGYFDSAVAAANYMPSHICRGDQKKEEDLKKTGYHLFYSPSANVVKSGWQSVMNSVRVFNKENQSKEAAILAAYMQEAHDKKVTVEWTSHRGGSFVLTEAMKLLVGKNVDLEGRQSIFLSDNTSSHAVADNYRRKLNMNTSEAKWVNSGYGIGQIIGGGHLGWSDIHSKWTVLTRDTAKAERPGKAYQFARDYASTVTSNHKTLAGAIAFLSAGNVTAAGAMVALKLLDVAISSTPSLTNTYQTRSDQAAAELISRTYSKFTGKGGA